MLTATKCMYQVVEAVLVLAQITRLMATLALVSQSVNQLKKRLYPSRVQS